MDMALDDMVNSTRKTRRPGGRGGRRGTAREDVLGKAPANPVTRARAAAQTAAPVGGQGFATKIVVSNLPVDVNEAQIKELFTATVGPLREVNLSYDVNGKSKGIAQVHFQRKGDGNKAYTEYNNRLIDGKRPMKIEIVVDPAHAPQALASRVAPATVAAADSGRGRGQTRGRATRGRGRRADGPKKSAADLDAEMEDYTSSNAGAASAAPAAAA